MCWIVFDKIIIPMLTYGSEIWGIRHYWHVLKGGVEWSLADSKLEWSLGDSKLEWSLIEHMNRGVFQSPVGTIVPRCT